MTSEHKPHSKAFVAYAWAFVFYLIAVILFGAWVRITHSGAGCGSHWPTCHGEVIPIAPSMETMIEYTHRLTSGLCGVFGLIWVGWAWNRFGRGRVFWATVLTLIFIIFEGAIGAGLVLRELVGSDDSLARAVVISLHLVNTLALTGSASLAAWWSQKTWSAIGPPESPPISRRVPSSERWLMIMGLVGLVVTSMTGAVTALGDTLFPVDPALSAGLFAQIREEVSAANHFLVRLRALHPLVAVIVALYLFALTTWLPRRPGWERAAPWARAVAILVVLQVFIGLINIALQAPGWIQLVHLALAQAVWISAVITYVARTQALATLSEIGR